MNKLQWSMVLIAVFVGGLLLGQFGWKPKIGSDGSHAEGSHAHSDSTESHQAQATLWTCSMHPQIKLPKPGLCPICAMDLIPLKMSSDDDDTEAPVLKMSKAALALAEVETNTINRGPATLTLNMVGKVDVDSTRIVDITLLAEGEIRRLFVNYSGVPVKKGEHLAEIYSPEVYAAAQDYFVALESRSENQELLHSAKLKLKLLGVPEDYIASIEKDRRVPETYTLVSPIDAYVENLSGYQGMWIKKGQMLCRMVNMEALWVLLDAYESDLAWLRYGQHVQLQAAALPGQNIEGVISYIPPRLDEKTRTVKVRVNVDNQQGQLKPGMFISAALKAEVNDEGQLTSSTLKGKWISPMHPEIVKNHPGACDVCGMPLIPAAELGFHFENSDEQPLLLPETAVLITGRRAVVYVRRPGDAAVFEGREVVIGPKAGAFYVVLSGLQAGEEVATKGNFMIDSALQILAKPSMMSASDRESLLKSPEVEAQKLNNININKNINKIKENINIKNISDTDKENINIKNIKNNNINIFKNTEALRASLGDYIQYYLSIQRELSQDHFAELNKLAGSMLSELDYADYSNLSGEALNAWNQLESASKEILKSLEKAENLEQFRNNFKTLSKLTVEIVQSFGHLQSTLQWMTCSMAAGDWLQVEPTLANPYYGASMLRCGEKKAELAAEPTVQE
jgi:membrane fusion protein, copper/silver efflux system